MTVGQLASFPNSRIKPRPARTATVGGNPLIKLTTAAAAFKVADANENRTDAVLRNLDSAVDLYYGYSNAVNPASNTGMLLKPLDSVTIEDPGEIWVYSTNAINISIDEGEG